MSSDSPVAWRGPVVHCLRDPGPEPDPESIEFFTDGVLLVDHGRIVQLAPAADLLPLLGSDVEIRDCRDRLIVPGMIDTHIHYPQVDVIASYGEQLIEWLERYTFPVEGRFNDSEHATEVASFFLDELLRNGTTTALVMCSVHPQSVDSFFAVAEKRELCMVAGKVLMDRHAPPFLCDTAEEGTEQSRSLIEKWHGHHRLHYAITPRFAPTSTDRQLELAGALASEYPDVYVHTHVAENHDEVAWVSKLFPHSRSYLDVYDQFNLLRDRSVFAHCLHLDKADRQRMADTGAAMAFCPTSNLFLGSGLFDLDSARDLGTRVGLATDVGGGTSFNMFQTASEAYKVLQLNGQSLPGSRALWLCTLAGAEALHLENRLGNFQPGKDADFLLLDPAATPLLSRRMENTKSIEEQLFVLTMLADDRVVATTVVNGKIAHQR